MTAHAAEFFTMDKVNRLKIIRTMFTCQNIGKYIEVWHYPDGRKELRLNGVILPYFTYNRIQEIDQAAIVDNKRLGQIPQFIKLVQDKRQKIIYTLNSFSGSE